METTGKLLRNLVILGVTLLLLGVWSLPAALAQVQEPPLNPNNIPLFVDPLPLLDIQGGTIQTVLNPLPTALQNIYMHEFTAMMLPTTTKLKRQKTARFPTTPQTYLGTKVWGYRTDATPPGPPQATYTGPVFVTTRNQTTPVKFWNTLPADIANSTVPFIKATIDTTLNWANPLNGQPSLTLPYASGPIPTAVHLHGGEVPPQLDGGPDSWFTSDGSSFGHAYYTSTVPADASATIPNGAIYRYPNSMEAAPIWFHDHGLGVTRLNVHAGLAGGYIITDNTNPPGPAALNNPAKIIPVVIQDRMFTVSGELYFDNAGINAEHPFWVPEFVGDVICVNGKSWPFLNVGPNSYRFLFVNGSNARAYELDLTVGGSGRPGPPMWVIGTDGGYLDNPVKLDPTLPQGKLVIMPGERYDVIIDFAGMTGQALELRNTARTPYPGGAPAQGSTTGKVMRFNVMAAPPAPPAPQFPPALGYTPAATTEVLRPTNPIIRLVDPATGTKAAAVTVNKIRQLTLNEVMGPGGPLEVLLNNTRYNGVPKTQPTPPPAPPTNLRADFTAVDVGGVTTYYSELPQEGQTEQWEIINLTADAHPIHLHLVQFQLMNRQAFDLNGYLASYTAVDGDGPPNPYNTPNIDGAIGGNPAVSGFLAANPIQPPLAQEAGWKDTVIMYPGQVTRIVVRWAPMDLPINTAAADLYFPFDPKADHGYVWHCHIIDHEDNEMMRPTQVQLNPAAPLPDARPLVIGTDY